MSNLQLYNASLSYGQKTILHNISVEIPRGQRVAIVGESGAGKSSLLALLREQAKDRCAWCPQQKGLVGSLSAFHNIYTGVLDQHSTLFNILNFFWPQASAQLAVTAIAEPLDIQALLKQKVAELSGGQQQRVAIARALIQNKSIFIGDEPISAVDEFMGQSILQKIIQQHETSIVALHDVDLALQCFDRIIGIKDGEIALDASSQTLEKKDLFFLYPHERI